MTFLEILGWAKIGMATQKKQYREAQDRAIKGQAKKRADEFQEAIEEIEVKEAILDEIREIHNRT